MTTLRKTVDQAAIDAWGELSGDLNPLHVDPAYAAGTRYGGTILHGHLTIAWLSEWGMREFGADWLRHGALADLRFRAPLRPGEEYAIIAAPGPDSPDGDAARLSVLLPDGTPAVTTTARLRAAEGTP